MARRIIVVGSCNLFNVLNVFDNPRNSECGLRNKMVWMF